MDKSEKVALFIGVTMLSLFFFAVLISAKVLNQDVPECVQADVIFEEGGLEEIEKGKLYSLRTVSHMWRFDPEEVTVPVGSEVDIYLTSADVVHGYYLRGVNCNLMAVPGAINKKTVKFNKPGVYPIYCHEYCGTGHQMMKGKIIVTP